MISFEVSVEGELTPEMIIQGMESQEGVEKGDMDDWAVTVGSPYAGYLEFGTSPAEKKPRGSTPRGTRDNRISAVQESFREWAKAKGKDPAFGDYVYRKVMREGMLPNPYLRPALYRVTEHLNDSSFWQGRPATVRTIAERIADEAERIVRDYSMGAGMEPYGHLADTIEAMRADAVPPSASSTDHGVTPDLWTDKRMNDGVHGKTARNPRLP